MTSKALITVSGETLDENDVIRVTANQTKEPFLQVSTGLKCASPVAIIKKARDLALQLHENILDAKVRFSDSDKLFRDFYPYASLKNK